MTEDRNDFDMHGACPDLAELEAFLVLDEEEERPSDPLANHIDRCSRCQQEIESLRKNNALLTTLRSALSQSQWPVHEESSDAISALASSTSISNAPSGYQIIEEVHRGAQGVVYRARQRGAKREVALKLLLAGSLATRKQRMRFEREVDLAASLRHPNIVTVYDSGALDDGRQYIAMELIDGVPVDLYVATIAQRGDHTPAHRLRAVIQLFVTISRAVAHAHSRGVIHRDLKPNNILVDETGEPHVLDFGLARPTELQEDASLATKSGEFLGTLAYAAPEQVAGDPSAVDVRTDVHALGVMLYEALSGCSPIVAESMRATLRQIEEGALIAPSRALADAEDSPFSWRLDADLDTIALKALAKEKDRRYQSAAALMDDLVRWLDRLPIEARRDSGWYVLRTTVRRHKAVTAIVITVILAFTIFTITVTSLYGRAAAEAAKARQVNIFLQDTFASVSGTPGREVTMRETLDEAVHWVEIALANQPEIAASLRSTVGASYRALGLYDKADVQITIALNLTRSLFGDSHPQTARALNLLGLLRSDQGELDDAQRLFDDALAIRLTHVGAQSIETGQSYYNIANLHVRREQFDDAEQYFVKCRDIRTDHLGPEHPDVAMCIYRIAQTKAERHDATGAEALHQEALRLRLASLHPEHPDIARSYLALGEAILEQGKPSGAIEYFRKCLHLRESALPEEDWRIAEAVSAIGRAQVAQGDFESATVNLLRAVASFTRTHGPDADETRRAAKALNIVTAK